MKIAIMGYSGSGKSTLARALGKKYGAEVLHLDHVHWLPGWKARSREDKCEIVKSFLDSHDSWVIDGNYTSVFEERRLEEADMIVVMLFGRIACYLRARKRLKKYRGKSRPDMGEGCCEKIDHEFVKWLFFGGRTKEKREHYRFITEKYREKTTVIKNQKELDRFMLAQTGRAEPEDI